MVYPSNHRFLDKNGCVLIVEKYSPFLQRYTYYDQRFKKWNFSKTFIVTMKLLVLMLIALVLMIKATLLFKHELFQINYFTVQFYLLLSRLSPVQGSILLTVSILILLLRTSEGIFFLKSLKL